MPPADVMQHVSVGTCLMENSSLVMIRYEHWAGSYRSRRGCRVGQARHGPFCGSQSSKVRLLQLTQHSSPPLVSPLSSLVSPFSLSPLVFSNQAHRLARPLQSGRRHSSSHETLISSPCLSYPLLLFPLPSSLFPLSSLLSLLFSNQTHQLARNTQGAGVLISSPGAHRASGSARRAKARRAPRLLWDGK